MAVSVSSVGTSFEAPKHERSGAFSTVPPEEYRRSLRSVSSALRIAEFDLKTSSRKTISADGSMPSTRRW